MKRIRGIPRMADDIFTKAPSSGGSLIQTYIAAIPFDFKLAVSTGLYIALFHYADRILINLSAKELVNE